MHRTLLVAGLAMLAGCSPPADKHVQCEGTFTVKVLADETYQWGDEHIDGSELRQHFDDLAERAPAPKVTIVADPKARFEAVGRIVFAYQQAKYPCAIGYLSLRSGKMETISPHLVPKPHTGAKQ